MKKTLTVFLLGFAVLGLGLASAAVEMSPPDGGHCEMSADFAAAPDFVLEISYEVAALPSLDLEISNPLVAIDTPADAEGSPPVCDADTRQSALDPKRTRSGIQAPAQKAFAWEITLTTRERTTSPPPGWDI